MSKVIKIDDPTINTFEISASQYQDFSIENENCPYTENARAVISRNKSQATILQTFDLTNGFTQQGNKLNFRIDCTKFRRLAGTILFFEFTGYKDGGRDFIKKIKINKSAL